MAEGERRLEARGRSWWRIGQEAMFELGDGADLQPRIDTSTLPYHPPHTLPRGAQQVSINPCFDGYTLPAFKNAMYRGSFAPPPAQSPPLHHPVPQHVSTVPMMRSPPPPPAQQTPNTGYGGSGGGNPYQPSPAQGGAPGFGGPGFGQFMTDPTAQMGFQVGKSAMMAGQEYMEQNVGSIGI